MRSLSVTLRPFARPRGEVVHRRKTGRGVSVRTLAAGLAVLLVPTAALTPAANAAPPTTDGLVLHLQADVGVVSSGGVVSGWSDGSGRGNSLSAVGQPGLTTTSTGAPAVSFDGVDDRLERLSGLSGLPSGGADRSVFVVASYQGVGYGGFSWGSRSCGRVFGTVVDRKGMLSVQGWCSDFVSSTAGTGAGWLTQSAVLSAGQLRHFKDGVLLGSKALAFDTTLERMVLGAEVDGSPHVDMDVAAVLVYDRALSAAERQSVEDYLRGKYVGQPPANVPPTAVGDAVTVAPGGSVQVPVLANDSDSDGVLVASSVAVVSGPARGTAVVNADGRVTYTHDGSVSSSDSFTYTVADDRGAVSAAATVTVTVAQVVNTPPRAVDDAVTVAPGGSVQVSVLANDSDSDGSLVTSSVAVVSGPARGTAVVNPDGSIGYTHDGSASTSDSFTYTVRDDRSALSNTATVRVTVAEVVPVSQGLVVGLQADVGVVSSGGVVSGWSDGSGRGNSLSAVGQPGLTTTSTGAPAVSFDGVDDRLERLSGLSGLPSGGADRSVFVVARYDGGGYGGFAFGSPSCNRLFGLGVAPKGQLMVQGWCTANDVVSSTAGTGAGWLTQSAVLSAGQLRHFKDGLLIGEKAHAFNTSVTRMVLGAEVDGSPHVDMDVAAVLVYDRALSAAERQSVEDYLRGKYVGQPPANVPPTAVGDAVTVAPGGSVQVPVLANDSDSDGVLVASSVAVVSGPARGTAVVNADGRVTYTHDGSVSSSDSFTYTVADDRGAVSAAATVTVTVAQVVNTPPRAVDDAVTVAPGGSVQVSVLANDSDSDGSLVTSSVAVVSGPARGTAVVNPDGSIGYTHDGSASTSDSFTYTVRDDRSALSNTATVRVTVAEVVPVSQGLVVGLQADVGVVSSGGVVSGWSDGSGRGNSLSAVGQPGLTTTSTGAPAVSFDGVDDRLERLSGLSGLPSGGADRSVFVVASYQGVGYGGFSWGSRSCGRVFGTVVDRKGMLSVQGWCSDFVSSTAGTGAGWLTQSAVLSAGQLRHFKDGVLLGSKALAFDTTLERMVLGAEVDGSPHVDMDVAAVLVYDRALSAAERQSVEDYLRGKYVGQPPANVPPTAVGDAVTVAPGGSVQVPVLANDSDSDGVLVASSVAVVSGPARGTAVVNADGRVTYTHDGSVSSSDSFTYTVADDRGAVSAAATVTVTVAQVVNTPPRAVDDAVTVAPGGSVQVSVLANDSDSDGSLVTSSVAVVSGPARGTAVVNPDGSIGYTHDGSASTSDSFTYTVRDDRSALSNTATVTITTQTDVNAPPTATADSASVARGKAVVVPVLHNDSDRDGTLAISSVTIVRAPAAGTATVNADGTITYRHSGGSATSDRLDYTVRDDDGAVSNAAALRLTISDFQKQTVVAGLNQPTSMAFLPDGRLLVLQKAGLIAITDPRVSPAVHEQYMRVEVSGSGERGLLDITLDPDFAANGFFYLYYSDKARNTFRIARFTHDEASGGTSSRGDLASGTVVWENPSPAESCCHFGGGLDVGPDGMLYLTTGEEFEAAKSQDLTLADGKIIRIGRDGVVPSDNPFVDGPGGNLDEIWALGLRNPFRARWDPPTGRLLIGEVGANDNATSTEDLHLGRRGANYGWPECQGPCGNPAYDDPIFSYPHAGSGAAITGGIVYRGSQFPTEYHGAYFYGDYVRDFVRYLVFDANGAVIADKPFAADAGAVVAIEEGPDGSLYIANIVQGSIARYVHGSVNNAPSITSAAATPTSGEPPLTVTFAGGATDAEGDPLTYTWSFGDGTSAVGASMSHTYASTGSYEAVLRVSDGSLTTTSAPLVITVGSPGVPTATITAPSDGGLFRAGDVITFEGTAVDPDEVLDGADFSWSVVFLHNEHTHPVLGPVSGTTGSFSIPTSGHDYASDTGYRITLTVTDSTGLTDTASVVVQPDKRNLTFETSLVEGGSVVLDGIGRTAPFTVDSLIGFQHTVEAPETICAGGVLHQFQSWSDGQARAHTITVGDAAVSRRATYVEAGACTSSPVP